MISCDPYQISLILNLLENDSVIGFGNNESGQLGLPLQVSTRLKSPERIESLCNVNVVQVACGRGHTIALTGMVEKFKFILWEQIKKNH